MATIEKDSGVVQEITGQSLLDFLMQLVEVFINTFMTETFSSLIASPTDLFFLGF